MKTEYTYKYYRRNKLELKIAMIERYKYYENLLTKR